MLVGCTCISNIPGYKSLGIFKQVHGFLLYNVTLTRPDHDLYEQALVVTPMVGNTMENEQLIWFCVYTSAYCNVKCDFKR